MGQHLKKCWWVPISPLYILFLYQQSFARNFILQFSVEPANPQLWGRAGRRGRGWHHSKEHWWVPISPPYILFLQQHSFARNFRLQFWVGVANPWFWGRGGRMRSGMVPFERALVSLYRPSIVTFPLSLRVSDILPLLFSSMPLFPYPTSSLPKISPCSLGVGGSPFGYVERRCRTNCSCNYFQDFQPMWSQSTNVTDGRTDRQTDDMRSQDRAFALKCIARTNMTFRPTTALRFSTIKLKLNSFIVVCHHACNAA